MGIINLNRRKRLLRRRSIEETARMKPNSPRKMRENESKLEVKYDISNKGTIKE
jgi:hypothetical protein